MLQNEVIIAECVRFYSKYWEDWNRVFYNKAKQSELLRKQCEEMQSHYENCTDYQIKSFVTTHPININ